MRTLIILLISCLTSLTALAQREQGRRFDTEKFEAAKIAYMSQRLDIKPEQATEFWPLYNQFDKKRKDLHFQLRNLMRPKEENISSEKAKEIISKKFELQQELLDIEIEFTKQVSEILDPIQVYKIGEIERSFLRHLYRTTRERGNREPDLP